MTSAPIKSASASHPLTWATSPPDHQALQAITTALSKLYPTTTTTSVPPPAQLIRPPRPQQQPRALPIVGDVTTWPDWPLWSRIGRCEQPGPGLGGIYWNPPAGHSGGPDSDYPGGLGILAHNWDVYRVPAGVETVNGALASPGEQIRVARALVAAVGGYNGWACY